MKALRFFSMTALALAFVACDKEMDKTVEPTLDGIPFTATIANPATKTTYTEEGTTINVAWKAADGVYEGDKIALVHNGTKDIATVTAVDASGSATIEGTITGSPSDNDDVVLVYPAAAVGSVTSGTTYVADGPTVLKVFSQDGTLGYIQDNIDFRQGAGKLAVGGTPATASLKASVSMPSQMVIWKLTLQDGSSSPLAATKVTVEFGANKVAETVDVSAKSVYYLGLDPDTGSGDLTISATVGSDTYVYKKTGGVSLTEGIYYQSTVTMAKFSGTVNLSSLNGNYEAKDGEWLTGTLPGNYKITIASGATVTLDGATLIGNDYDQYAWAGLTCLGNATINLMGTNTVKGFHSYYPGIFVPEGSTLTILGPGSLTATHFAASDLNAVSGAGIGGGNGIACGNIVIKGGTITAIGGRWAAGIGGGQNASCGTITITSSVKSVNATKGNNAPNSIGAGYNGSCGTVTIGGTVYWSVADGYKNGGDTYLTTSPLVYPAQ